MTRTWEGWFTAPLPKKPLDTCTALRYTTDMINSFPTHLLSRLETVSVLSFLVGYAPDTVEEALLLTLGSDRLEELKKKG